MIFFLLLCFPCFCSLESSHPHPPALFFFLFASYIPICECHGGNEVLVLVPISWAKTITYSVVSSICYRTYFFTFYFFFFSICLSVLEYLTKCKYMLTFAMKVFEPYTSFVSLRKRRSTMDCILWMYYFFNAKSVLFPSFALLLLFSFVLVVGYRE